MHQSKRERVQKEAKQDRQERTDNHPQLGRKRRVANGSGPALGKVLVQAVLEREGEVRAQILETFGTLERLEFIHQHVEKGSGLMTDTGNANAGKNFVHGSSTISTTTFAATSTRTA